MFKFVFIIETIDLPEGVPPYINLARECNIDVTCISISRPESISQGLDAQHSLHVVGSTV